MCSPPPVQLVCLAALSSTHLAVTSEPHDFTPVAHRRNADADCSPSRPIVPCDFATRLMYCFTAGTWFASSNGTPVMRTYTLLPAPPFWPFHWRSAAVYWFGSVTHAFGVEADLLRRVQEVLEVRVGRADPHDGLERRTP